MSALAKGLRYLKEHGILSTLKRLVTVPQRQLIDEVTLKRAELKKYVELHNDCYRKISVLAIELNDGVHPKHRIMDYHEHFKTLCSPGDRLIDIGCGNGYLAYDLAAKVEHVTGIDIKPENLVLARKRFHRDNIHYLVGDATSYTFDQGYDKIVLSNVLEHIENRIDFLQKIRSLSDIMLLRVPMISRDWVSVYKMEQGLPYKLDSTHFTEFTLSQLESELDQGGWCIETYSIQFGEFWGLLKKK